MTYEPGKTKSKIKTFSVSFVSTIIIFAMGLGSGVIYKNFPDISGVEFSLILADPCDVNTPADFEDDFEGYDTEGTLSEPLQDTVWQYKDILMEVTAYCPCVLCCGEFADGITASGRVARSLRKIQTEFLRI